jgi:activator of 2-hydroxyglutaryl-CoA dehydratase
MSITKAHLADSIHNQLGLHKNQSVKVLESILEIIKETLENGEDVMITGFGKFYVREKKGTEREESELLSRVVYGALGGDPIFFYTIDKYYTSNYFCQFL